MTVRLYNDSDRAEVLKVWEAALPLDSLTDVDFRRRVLLDENHDPKGFLVAVDNSGRPRGFVLSLVVRHPPEIVELLAERGFITAFGVHPEAQRQGHGTALLSAAEDFLRSRGRKLAAISPYPPNYFVPGIDRERYSEGLAFLKRHGYEEYIEAIAADALIGQFELNADLREKEKNLAAEGLTIEELSLDSISEFLSFMREVMPGDWVYDARLLLQRMVGGQAPDSSVLVARDAGRIVGYCKFEGQHFGPFGVAQSHQGRGIGSVLLARTLLEMRKRGAHAAYVLWTGERAAQGVYGRLGFRITRRFAILRKPL